MLDRRTFLVSAGVSARGVAVDTALPDRPEEFPRFSEFYIETPRVDGDSMVVYALLDGPSITGAYRFDLHRRAGVVMEIQSTLLLRKEVGRLGLAPLSSMYWFSETKKPTGLDWRPDVHDSDGLAVCTGSGERLWRPLNNPRRCDRTQLFCVDFTSELGQRFNKECQPGIDVAKFARLKSVFETLAH